MRIPDPVDAPWCRDGFVCVPTKGWAEYGEDVRRLLGWVINAWLACGPEPEQET